MKPSPDFTFESLLADYLREMRTFGDDPAMIEIVMASYLAGAIGVRVSQAHISTLPKEEWESQLKLIDDQITKAMMISSWGIDRLGRDVAHPEYARSRVVAN